MKKKILATIMITVIAFSMVRCSSSGEVIDTITTERYSISSKTFTEGDLVYDTNTRIVYIENYTYNGNFVYTPYLSSNGLPYRYIGGELLEVNNNENL